jgi:micrococcal nuclease
VLSHTALPASLNRLLLGALRAALVSALVLAGSSFAGCGDAGHREAGLAFPGPSRTHSARVTKVTDGDTIWLSRVGKVRLIGVDTPEVYGEVECYGRRASAFTKRVLRPRRRVRYRLGTDPRDRYGRALAYVWLSDGRLFNALLVERGYAQPLTIPPNDDYARLFVAAARRARQGGRGLWGVPGCAGG